MNAKFEAYNRTDTLAVGSGAAVFVVSAVWALTAKPTSIFKVDSESNTMMGNGITFVFALLAGIAVAIGAGLLNGYRRLGIPYDSAKSAAAGAAVLLVLLTIFAVAKPRALRTNETRDAVEEEAKLDWMFALLIALPSAVLTAGIAHLYFNPDARGAESRMLDEFEAAGLLKE